MDFKHGNFHNAVVANVDPSGFEIKKTDGLGKVELHTGLLGKDNENKWVVHLIGEAFTC